MTKRKVSTAARKAQRAKTDELADRGEPADGTARGEGHGQAAQEQDALLRERARQIISELGTAEASVLQQWMAHYLSELMQRADDPTLSALERAAAHEECVRLIARMWQLELARERTRLGFALCQPAWFTARRSRKEPSLDLASALADSAVVLEWPAPDRLLALFLLAELEQEIVRFLFHVSLVASGTKLDEALTQRAGAEDATNLKDGDDATLGSRADEEDDSEGSPEAFKREAQRARTVLAAAFPQVGDLDLADYPGASQFATQGLLKVLGLKAVLLGLPLEHLDPALSLRESRAKAGKRAARPRTTGPSTGATRKTGRIGSGPKLQSGSSSGTKPGSRSKPRKRKL